MTQRVGYDSQSFKVSAGVGFVRRSGRWTAVVVDTKEGDAVNHSHEENKVRSASLVNL